MIHERADQRTLGWRTGPGTARSLVIEETDERYEVLEQRVSDDTHLECHFNGVAYAHGALVCSGNEMLCCDNGAWLRQGSCDVDNP